MAAPEAEESPGAYVLDAFLKWIEALYGKGEAAALRDLARDGGAHLEPETWVFKLEAAVADLQARRPVTDERIERAFPLLVEAQQLLASPSEDDERLLRTEPGLSFLAFLH